MISQQFNGDLWALDEYARQRENALRRRSYARHPERVLRQRLRCAVRLLRKYGWISTENGIEVLSGEGRAVL